MSELDHVGSFSSPRRCSVGDEISLEHSLHPPQVLRLLNHSHVPVLRGRFPAKYNEFPKVWRELAAEMLQVADIYLQELPQMDPAEAGCSGSTKG